jgi:hypothetical protein
MVAVSAVDVHGEEVPAPRLRRADRHERDRPGLRARLDHRPVPAAQDGPAKGAVRHAFYGTDKLGFGVTRADIAAFTAAQVDDARYIGAAPAISN